MKIPVAFLTFVSLLSVVLPVSAQLSQEEREKQRQEEREDAERELENIAEALKENGRDLTDLQRQIVDAYKAAHEAILRGDKVEELRQYGEVVLLSGKEMIRNKRGCSTLWNIFYLPAENLATNVLYMCSREQEVPFEVRVEVAKRISPYVPWDPRDHVDLVTIMLEEMTYAEVIAYCDERVKEGEDWFRCLRAGLHVAAQEALIQRAMEEKCYPKYDEERDYWSYDYDPDVIEHDEADLAFEEAWSDPTTDVVHLLRYCQVLASACAVTESRWSEVARYMDDALAKIYMLPKEEYHAYYIEEIVALRDNLRQIAEDPQEWLRFWRYGPYYTGFPPGERWRVKEREDQRIEAERERWDEAHRKRKYVLRPVVEGPGSISLSPPGGIYDYGVTVKVEAHPKEGYRTECLYRWVFYPWREWEIDMDEDVLLDVRFIRVPSLGLTVDVVGKDSASGTVLLDPPPEQFGGCYPQGTKVKLTAQAAPGSLFDHWNDDEDWRDISIERELENYPTFTAHFSLARKLVVTKQGQGTATSKGEEVYLDGKKVWIWAKPYKGWVLERWNGDGLGDDDCVSVTMDSDKQVEVVFRKLKTFGFSTGVTTIKGALNGEGGSVAIYPQLPATACVEGSYCWLWPLEKPGYDFRCWLENGREIGTERCQCIIVNQDEHITAVFSPSPELVTPSDHFGIKWNVRADEGMGYTINAYPHPDHVVRVSATEEFILYDMYPGPVIVHNIEPKYLHLASIPPDIDGCEFEPIEGDPLAAKVEPLLVHWEGGSQASYVSEPKKTVE